MSENSFEREILDRLIKIEAKLESWDKSKEQVYINQRDIIKLQQFMELQQEETEELKEQNKWLARTVTGVAVTVLGSIVTACIKAF